MLCEQLKALRDGASLTNSKWAELSGVSLPTITRYLNDPNANPQFYHIDALVKAAGGSIDILTGITPDRITQTEGYGANAYALYLAVIREERKEKRMVAITLAFFVLLIVALFVYDFMHLDRGWIQEVSSLLSENA